MNTKILARLTVVVLATAAIGTAGVTSAAAKSTVDPNQAVASDHSVVSTLAVSPHMRVVPGSKGTGRLEGAGVQTATPGPRVEGRSVVTPNEVIGTDDRFRVTGTTNYPASATVQLLRPGGANCTGSLISPDTVATAGHCVYDTFTRQWITNIIAYPGVDGLFQPYGYCTARVLYSVAGWVNNLDPLFDYGVVKLNCTVGNAAGWYAYGWSAGSLVNYGVNVQGYPLEKPSATQWSAFGRTQVESNFQLEHDVDTTAGNSGSPIYTELFGTYPTVIAIHTYGRYGASPFNRGTRINQQVFNNLYTWTTL